MSCPLFKEFPGIEVPVGQVMSALERVWQSDGPQGEDPSITARALQVNWVLHCGADTPTSEGIEKFQAIMAFSQICPSRIIVLCANPDCDALRAKLFAQCYVGGRKLAALTTEALILSYPADAVGFLKDQVSIWIDNDLPTYYCLHRVDPVKILQHDDRFLKNCKRIVYDSAVDGDCFADVAVPGVQRLVDLCFVNTLPIRKILGQFCARWAPEKLVNGLKEVRIEACGAHIAQARCLLAWLKKTLAACGSIEGVVFNCIERPDVDCSVEINWGYRDPECTLRVQCCEQKGKITLESRFDGLASEQTLPLVELSPEQLLQACIG